MGPSRLASLGAGVSLLLLIYFLLRPPPSLLPDADNLLDTVIISKPSPDPNSIEPESYPTSIDPARIYADESWYIIVRSMPFLSKSMVVPNFLNT